MNCKKNNYPETNRKAVDRFNRNIKASQALHEGVNVDGREEKAAFGRNGISF